MTFDAFLKSLKTDKQLSQEALSLFRDFFETYRSQIETIECDQKKALERAQSYLQAVVNQMEAPYTFEHFHQSLREPVDYFQMGLTLFAPFVDQKNSRLLGEDSIKKMCRQLEKKENVILFSNHQTEADPQLMILSLKEKYPELIDQLVFVAGHRVTQDLLAIPLSLGLNLLCIYSKKYLESPPEKKADKQAHNQRTLKEMKRLLQEGGVCIYVACSGGRDRPDATGAVHPAPFDPQSVELFHLIAKQAKTPTHFYPLAMYTYPILPPPDHVAYALGEKRIFGYSPAHFFYGKELDMEELLESDCQDKKQQRQLRSQRIWTYVCDQYKELTP